MKPRGVSGKCESGFDLPANDDDCPTCGAGPDDRCPKAVLKEQAELTTLRAAIKKISEQMTSDELLEEHGDDLVSDYEAGYDTIIKLAREALAKVSA